MRDVANRYSDIWKEETFSRRSTNLPNADLAGTTYAPIVSEVRRGVVESELLVLPATHTPMTYLAEAWHNTLPVVCRLHDQNEETMNQFLTIQQPKCLP